jgi:SAM-dependent methyltransferase
VTARPGAALDLGTLAENLVMAEEGFWVSPGHQDLKFVDAETTDWVRIEDTSYWYAHRNRCFAAVIRQYPPRETLFEVGAGNGSVALAIQNAGFTVVAIEPTVRLARNAKKRGLQNVVCSDLENARFRQGALANVGMFDVLEHIPADADYLRRLRAMMPVGGRLYCAVPAWRFLWSLEDEAAGHVRRYSLGELRRKISDAGFVVEHSTYYFAALIVPIFLLRALPTLLGFRRPRSPESTASEHSLKPGIISWLASNILGFEARWLESARRVPLGASCLVVARAA